MSDWQIALLLVALSAGLALGTRLIGPFDGLYGQDAYAYLRYAAALWPWLLRGEPLPIYYWPSGYPLLVMLVLPLVGWSSAAGQVVSALSGAAAGALTFLLSRELLSNAPGGRIGALAAALIVVCSGALLRANLVVMSDATALACCVAASWAVTRYARTQRGRWLIVAALALAWAIITRWVCGLLALPLALYLLCRRVRSEAPLPIVVRDWVAATTVGALVVIPQVLVSQATPGAPGEHPWVIAWSFTHAWQRTFTTVDGTQHYALPLILFNLAQMAGPGFLAPFGAAWLVLRRRWAALVLVGGWPLTLLLFLSGIPFENARFVLPGLAALAVLSGIGFGWAYAVLTGRRRLVLMAGLALALTFSVVRGRQNYQTLVDDKNDQLALVAWVQAQLPAGATLLTFGPTLTFQHYTASDVRELYYLDLPDLDRIAGQPNPTYALLDVGNIERQWVGLPPERNYRSLQRNPGLAVVGRYGPFTLFQLQEPEP